MWQASPRRGWDRLLQKAHEGQGFWGSQRALLSAIDNFVRKPAVLTTGAPHVRDAVDLKRTMVLVVIALLPCLLFGIYNTGRGAYLSVGHEGFTLWQAMLEGALHVLPLVLLSYAVGGACEILFAQLRGHEVAEGFLVTGLLYPLVCPATIPWWMFALGIVFGVVIGKEVFGGTGMNMLNPALLARAFVFFAYPAHMSGEVWIASPVRAAPDGGLTPAKWTTIPRELIERFISGGGGAAPDGYSGPTALALVNESAPGGGDVLAALRGTYPWWDCFWGFVPGSIGETSTAMCLLGAAVLIITGIGSARTMLGCVIGCVVTSALFYPFSGAEAPVAFGLTPLEHLVMGGFAFGAVFMATDPVSSPFHPTSRFIYGCCIGSLCVLIRLVNPAYPEGMMLAILFMNVFAPLIDHYVVEARLRRRAAHAY
ncbi:MAG: NADH:ubiquinone reductase (Na(+)-transporting) subunit B [Myxococcota bacterium]